MSLKQMKTQLSLWMRHLFAHSYMVGMTFVQRASLQFEDPHTILIAMRKEIGDLRLIQDLLHTQSDTLILQADTSIFSSAGPGAQIESVTNQSDALIQYFSVVFNYGII